MKRFASASEARVFNAVVEESETASSVDSRINEKSNTLRFDDLEKYPEAKSSDCGDAKADREIGTSESANFERYLAAVTSESVDSVAYAEIENSEFEDSTADPQEYEEVGMSPEREISSELTDTACKESKDVAYGLQQGLSRRKAKEEKKAKKKKQVFLEGYVESESGDDLSRTKSLTDEDLDELKGCVDLGFGFNYDEIPELCNTLPALELCYSISQKFLDEQPKPPQSSSPMADEETSSSASGPIASWRISNPGDHPEEVKARLKFWAQAVACTVRLCS